MLLHDDTGWKEFFKGSTPAAVDMLRAWLHGPKSGLADVPSIMYRISFKQAINPKHDILLHHHLDTLLLSGLFRHCFKTLLLFSR